MPTTKQKPEPIYKTLILDGLWERLVKRVMNERRASREKAEMCIDSALGFLKMCGEYPQHKFAPVPMVDVGWHIFLLYTREYAEFCERICGRFVHHRPNDDSASPISDIVSPLKTLEFMEEHRIAHDPRVWNAGTTNPMGRCADCIPD